MCPSSTPIGPLPNTRPLKTTPSSGRISTTSLRLPARMSAPPMYVITKAHVRHLSSFFRIGHLHGTSRNTPAPLNYTERKRRPDRLADLRPVATDRSLRGRVTSPFSRQQLDTG